MYSKNQRTLGVLTEEGKSAFSEGSMVATLKGKQVVVTLEDFINHPLKYVKGRYGYLYENRKELLQRYKNRPKVPSVLDMRAVKRGDLFKGTSMKEKIANFKQAQTKRRENRKRKLQRTS